MGFVLRLPGGVRGEDRMHRLGAAVSHAGERPVGHDGYDRSTSDQTFSPKKPHISTDSLKVVYKRSPTLTIQIVGLLFINV